MVFNIIYIFYISDTLKMHLNKEQQAEIILMAGQEAVAWLQLYK